MWLVAAWQELSVTTILNCWCKSGVLPGTWISQMRPDRAAMMAADAGESSQLREIAAVITRLPVEPGVTRMAAVDWVMDPGEMETEGEVSRKFRPLKILVTDQNFEEAYAYLVSKTYPECVNETKKRVIRRKAAKLTISVKESYCISTSRERTLYRIKERFMWHGKVKDIVSLLQRTEVVTINDYFTKWVEVVPTVNKMASTVASSLFKIFMRMGLPPVLLSDNGSEFCNALNDQLSEMLGIKRRLTTPYHPQANGLDERFNQTLQNMLVKYVSSKKDMWSHYLDTYFPT
eukprot:Em0005g1418a